jgi:hypothetical protein
MFQLEMRGAIPHLHHMPDNTALLHALLNSYERGKPLNERNSEWRPMCNEAASISLG